MNTYIIQLKKVSQNDLQILKMALNHYVQTLQFLTDTLRDRKYSLDMSIGIELWFDLDKKTRGQYPPENPSIKLSLHQGYILLDALQEFKRDIDNQYQKSRCNGFMMAIDQQLPTFTQLSISK